jgi:hypothetical protein
VPAHGGAYKNDGEAVACHDTEPARMLLRNFPGASPGSKPGPPTGISSSRCGGAAEGSITTTSAADRASAVNFRAVDADFTRFGSNAVTPSRSPA